MRNAAHDKWISDPSASASMAFHLTRFALRSRNAVLMIRLALRSSIFAASQGFQSLSLSSAPSQHARLLATSVNSKPRLLEGAADRLCRLGLCQTAGSQDDRRLRRALSSTPFAPGAARNGEAVASIRS
jgi:hypothetical protein